MPKPCDLAITEVSITGAAAEAAPIVGTSTLADGILGTTSLVAISGTSTLANQITGTTLEVCDTVPDVPTVPAWATESGDNWKTETGGDWILE